MPEKGPSILQTLKDAQELFFGSRQGKHPDQEVSTPRLYLRAMGHIATATEFEDSDFPGEAPYVPPVNGWEVMKSVAKAVVNKGHRKEILGRMKEELIPDEDLMGFLGMLQSYRLYREMGLSEEESRNETIEVYKRLAENTRA